MTARNDIRGIVREELRKLCFREVGPEEDLRDRAVLDSLGRVDLAVALEERLGVSISDRELISDSFRSAAALCELLAAKLGAREEG